MTLDQMYQHLTALYTLGNYTIPSKEVFISSALKQAEKSLLKCKVAKAQLLNREDVNLPPQKRQLAYLMRNIVRLEKRMDQLIQYHPLAKPNRQARRSPLQKTEEAATDQK